jgi:MoaA/NifB/PqqE/SkfB family radical SAM enzyme
MDKLLEIANNYRIPLNVKIEITHKCNFKCLYCFQGSLKTSKSVELSVQEWKAFLNILAKKKCLCLTITGGELCTKKGIAEIYEYAYKLGFIIDLHSNLYLMDKSPLFEKMKKYRPNKVVVTIYGDNNKTYEDFCSVKNGWNKVKNNILSLKRVGIDVGARSVFHKKNINCLEGIKEFVEKNDIPINVYTSIIKDCDLITRCDNLDISLSESFKIYKEFDKLEEIKNLLLSKDHKLYCSAGLSSFFINPYGDMFLCPSLFNIAKKFNIRYGFDFCWNELFRERKKYITCPTPCEGCINANFCKTCKANYIKEYNNNYKDLLRKCKKTQLIKNKLNINNEV